MTIKVLTVPGQPTFKCGVFDPKEIDRLVEEKYGRQSNGLPHNWFGQNE